MHPKTEQQTPNQLIMSKYSDQQSIQKNKLQNLHRIGGSFSGSQNHKRIHSHANEKRTLSVENSNFLQQSLEETDTRAEIKSAFKKRDAAVYSRKKMPSLMSKPDKSVQFAQNDTSLTFGDQINMRRSQAAHDGIGFPYSYAQPIPILKNSNSSASQRTK